MRTNVLKHSKDQTDVPSLTPERAKKNKDLFNRLKERIFDLSRRNKLLHFRNSGQFISLSFCSKKAKIDDIIEHLKKGKTNLTALIGSESFQGLERIRRQAQRNNNEYGFNQLRLILSFLVWNDPKKNKDQTIVSPLLLLPINLSRKRGIHDQYDMELADETIEVNPVLRYYFKENFDVKLPREVKFSQKGINDFYEEVKQLVDVGNLLVSQTDELVGASMEEWLEHHQMGNHSAWLIDTHQVGIGNFDYRKMALVEDYDRLISTSLSHPLFNELFSDQAKDVELLTPEEKDFAVGDGYNVLPYDPSQNSAISLAKSGANYVIQGPPGTGKSQTITNLIANFVAQEKKVLFVCEKRAAIDVVYHRLKIKGLNQVVARIHDSQTDKKQFIHDLKRTHEKLVKPGEDVESLERKRKFIIDNCDIEFNQLRRFSNEMEHVDDRYGLSFIDLLFRMSVLKDELVEVDEVVFERLPNYCNWSVYEPVLIGLTKALRNAGGNGKLASHPARLLNESVFEHEKPIDFIQNELLILSEKIEVVQKVFSEIKLPSKYVKNISTINRVFTKTLFLEKIAEANLLFLVTKNSSKTKQYNGQVRKYKSTKKRIIISQETTKHWIKKLSRAELESAKSVLESGKWWKKFTKPYKKIIHSIEKYYDFSQHDIDPEHLFLIEQLLSEYHLQDELRAIEEELEEEFGIKQPDLTIYMIDDTRKSLQKNNEELITEILQRAEGDDLIKKLTTLKPEVDRLNSVLRRVFVSYRKWSLDEVLSNQEAILGMLNSIPQLIPALKGLAVLPESLKEIIRTTPLTVMQLEALLVKKSLVLTYRYNHVLKQFDFTKVESVNSIASKYYEELMGLNNQIIIEKIRSQFINHISVSQKPAAKLTPEQKEFKKKYNKGRKVLENEFNKTRRYKSIRELTSCEAKHVIHDLKPVWLMSPLSLSDALPLEPDFFDVVIFDEASQIALEEGVPALFRANQTIIVGDEMQLPPTQFFGAKNKPEEVKEDLTGIEQSISLLDQATLSFPSRMLKWHYRSKYETLIAFSNAAFYNNELLTIPDIHSFDRLKEKPISFHCIDDGLYENRTNKNEANFVANFIRERLLSRKEKESMGIVTFSMEQQVLIEKELDLLAQQDEIFAKKLEEEYQRTEQDQFVGLFVKNLENVQGDERDIIIISVCYGYNGEGKIAMNFGPINREGGSKRLNVLFSRAKKHIAIVSSIRHYDITNEDNQGANHLKRFLQYGELLSEGKEDEAKHVLRSLASKKNEEHYQPSFVEKQIAKALHSQGYETEFGIGTSELKCSIAIKENGIFKLGLIVDDLNFHKSLNVADHYFFRQKILSEMGWEVQLVLTKDWYHQPDVVLQKITSKLK